MYGHITTLSNCMASNYNYLHNSYMTDKMATILGKQWNTVNYPLAICIASYKIYFDDTRKFMMAIIDSCIVSVDYSVANWFM